MPYKDIEKKRENNRKWYKEHSGEVKKRAKVWGEMHPEKVKERIRKWREKNCEIIKEYKRKWHKLHPESQIKANNRIRNTIKGQIDNRMCCLVYQSLKRNKGGRSWEILAGYTKKDLKCHIQNKFTKGMTWAKFMAGEIHIDHVVPRSHFKYTTPEDPQFKECWALHNLQPLWAKENIAKGNRRYQLPLILYKKGE